MIRALGWLTGLLVSAAIVAELPVALAAAAQAAQAQAADPADIAEGMRLYQQKGNCQACHGWAADGRKADNQMPDGPNLRETKLDRNRLVVTIKCGRPGTQHAGLRQVRLQRRALLRHEAGAAEVVSDAHARPAGDVAAARDRPDRRLSVQQGHRQGPDGSCQVHRILGLGRRSLQRVSRNSAFPTSNPVSSARRRTGSWNPAAACRTSPDAGGGRRPARRDTASARSRR